MDRIYPWLGDLNAVAGLGRLSVGLICILASVFCGTIIGIERERRDKPAGLRTLILISVGSTIFTIVSLLFAEQKGSADPARLASQIVAGIGFLGAGAIIRAHGTVHGLTTAATIWTVAAVGVTVGSGHVVAGLGFTVVILATLTVMQRLETLVVGACENRRARLTYDAARGKTQPRLQAILDRYSIPDERVTHGESAPDERWLTAEVCVSHHDHREVLSELVEIEQVRSLVVE